MSKECWLLQFSAYLSWSMTKNFQPNGFSIHPSIFHFYFFEAFFFRILLAVCFNRFGFEVFGIHLKKVVMRASVRLSIWATAGYGFQCLWVCYVYRLQASSLSVMLCIKITTKICWAILFDCVCLFWEGFGVISQCF